MTHYITLRQLPKYNNDLLVKSYEYYKCGDKIAVNISGDKVTYFYIITAMCVFGGISYMLVSRTFSNYHRL